MSKRRKKWILIGAGLFFGSVAALFYLAMREDPQYVSAAQGLEKTRAEAKAAFGTLTWDEYREERGVEFRDDRKAWESLAASIPQRVKDYDELVPQPTVPRSEVYGAEREWFDALPSKIATLKILHIYHDDATDWTIEIHSNVKDIMKALRVAIIGAADSGDVEAMRSLVQTAVTLIEKAEEEPSGLSSMVSNSLRSYLVFSLGRAAIKNRSDAKVFDAAEGLLKQFPIPPHPADIIAAQFRTSQVYLDTMRSLPSSDVDAWLDTSFYGLPEQTKTSTLTERLRTVWDSIFSEQETIVRRTGPHTKDALEARVTESMVELWHIAKADECFGFQASEEIDEFVERLQESDDASYELAAGLIYLRFLNTLRHDFYLHATGTALEMAHRFPTYADLPNALPADLESSYEYGRGALAVYRKTPTGYVLYSRASDGTDAGFIVSGELSALYISPMRMDDTRSDMGFAVNYLPTNPLP